MTWLNKITEAFKQKSAAPKLGSWPTYVPIAVRKWVVTKDGVGIITAIADSEHVNVDLVNPENGETIRGTIADLNYTSLACYEDIPECRRPSPADAAKLGYFPRGAR